MKTRLATLVAVLGLVVTLPAQQAVRRFTFDDLSRVKRVAEPQLSPDGGTLAVIISTPNLDENRHMASLPTHVWMVPATGGDMKHLTSGTWTLPVTRPPGSPSSILTWTPDGSSIVFSRSGGAVAGLQAVNIADGATTPLNLTGAHYAPVKRLTDVNGEIASLPLGRTEVVTFKNEEYEPNAILTYPPDFIPTKKYPMVLLIHVVAT